MHAKYLQPSKAAQWMACPGSITLTEVIPDQSSEYADWGTDVHRIAEAILKGDPIPNDIPPDDEKLECAQAYVRDLQPYLKDADWYKIEALVPFGRAIGVDDPEDAFGSADAIVFSNGELQVHDLKTGTGVKVFAERNPQLMLYALGAYEGNKLLEDIQSIRLVIHQPRLEHLDEWDCSVEDLMVFCEEVAAAAHMVLDAKVNQTVLMPDAWQDMFLNPGNKQCRWCRAKATCPAHREEMLAMVSDDFVDLENQGGKLSNLTERLPQTDSVILGRMYPHLDRIIDWANAVRAELERRVFAGDPELGQFKIVQGKRGARRWEDPSVVGELAHKKRLKLFEESLLSPTQAEKLHKAGAIGPRNWAELQQYIVQPPGKPAVVMLDDPRPAISVADDFEVLS